MFYCSLKVPHWADVIDMLNMEGSVFSQSLPSCHRWNLEATMCLSSPFFALRQCVTTALRTISSESQMRTTS